MQNLTQSVQIWHDWFSDEDRQYAEYEPSDIEYFIGVMLYNQFQFSLAVETMQTMDVGADFLEATEESFDEVVALLKEIRFENELDAVNFLLDFIHDSQEKYTKSERYLLDRLDKHITLLKARYDKNEKPQKVDFVALSHKS